jgi:FAD-dependent oxidoreductase family protein
LAPRVIQSAEADQLEEPIVSSQNWRVRAALLLLSSVSCCAVPAAQNGTVSIRVVDPLKVSTAHSPSSAILTLAPPVEPESISCDVLVVGASVGGVAAALAAAQGNHTVCLTEETYWIGGQMTSQGVSALDENEYIETTGATASYHRVRDAIRQHYRQHYQLSGAGARLRHFNPGSCWVSSLCFEPRVGFDVLRSVLQPYLANSFLRVFLRTKAVSVERSRNRLTSVLTYGFDDHRWIAFHAVYVLDATDTGELLPLAGADYVRGAESRSLTGEPHAREGASDPGDLQSFTYTFALARDAAHDHPLPKPLEYEVHRTAQPYTLTLDDGGGKLLTYRMFEKASNTEGAFWTYRRLIAAGNFRGSSAPVEMSMVNWPGNDYCGPGLLSDDPDKQAEALRGAKLTSLGLAYWLQNEVPRDDGSGQGYPGLELLPQALGSADGLSQFPYVRESRRIQALETIREQDISARYQKGARARLFPDSVGIGLYPIDIHGCSRHDFSSPTRPFQVPLGALIPKDFENLLAASKDIGTTHLTNGAYRLHPIEWAIGEAAGTLADFALDRSVTPAHVQSDVLLTQQLELILLERGAPIYWFNDIPAGDPAFLSAQFLAAQEIFGGSSSDLHFAPHRSLTRGEAVRALARVVGPDAGKPGAEGKRSKSASLSAASKSLIALGYLPSSFPGEGSFKQDLMWSDVEPACEKTGVEAPLDRGTFHPATRAAFAIWLVEVYRRQAGLKW